MSILKIPTLIHGVVHGPHKPDEFAKYGYNGPDLQNQREFDMAKKGWKHTGVYLKHHHSAGPCGTVVKLNENKDKKLEATMWINPEHVEGKKIMKGLLDGTITQLSLGQRNIANKDGLNIKEIRPLEISVVEKGGRDDCNIKWFTNNNKIIQMANPDGYTPELFKEFIGLMGEEGIPAAGFKNYVLESKKRRLEEQAAFESARTNKRVSFINGLSELASSNPELAIMRDELPKPEDFKEVPDAVIDIFAGFENNYRQIAADRKRLIEESLQSNQNQKALQETTAKLQVELKYEKERNANRQDRVQPQPTHIPAYQQQQQQVVGGGGAIPASAHTRSHPADGLFDQSEYGPRGTGSNKPRAVMSAGAITPNLFDFASG